MKTHCECRIHLCHLRHLYESWGAKGSTMSMKVMMLVVPWVIKVIISDPGVSCFLPVSMKLWQANLDKILHLKRVSYNSKLHYQKVNWEVKITAMMTPNRTHFSKKTTKGKKKRKKKGWINCGYLPLNFLFTRVFDQLY